MLRVLKGTQNGFAVLLVAGCTVGAFCFAVGRRSKRNGKSKSSADTQVLQNIVGEYSGHNEDCADNAAHAHVRPTAIATWRFGAIALEAAKPLLTRGGTALDALEAGKIHFWFYTAIRALE